MKEKFGAKGNMTLKNYWEEYSGGNKEDSELVTLEASLDTKTIILTENIEHTDFYKRSNDVKKEIKYAISAERLIELIKQNGKEIK